MDAALASKEHVLQKQVVELTKVFGTATSFDVKASFKAAVSVVAGLVSVVVLPFFCVCFTQ